MSSEYSVLVADADEATQRTISALVGGIGWRLLYAETGDEAIDVAHRDRPDVVVLEVELPGLGGYEVCALLRAEFGEALPIVLLSTVRADPRYIAAGLLIGADDYLTKPFVPEELIARIHALLRRAGRRSSPSADALTPRQLEVLSLLTDGLSPREIAEYLVISPHTLRTHTEQILRKLGVRSRTEAVAMAYRNRLVARGRIGAHAGTAGGPDNELRGRRR